MRRCWEQNKTNSTNDYRMVSAPRGGGREKELERRNYQYKTGEKGGRKRRR